MLCKNHVRNGFENPFFRKKYGFEGNARDTKHEYPCFKIIIPLFQNNNPV